LSASGGIGYAKRLDLMWLMLIEAYVHYQGTCTSGHMITATITPETIQKPA